mgnify:CR=1 FL=1
MVEETIRVIRETESQADQIVKHAQDQYNKLLEEARKEADKIRTEQLQSAKQKAEQEMEAARSRGETAAANIAIEQEIKALKENALKKEAEAVELVISKLV